MKAKRSLSLFTDRVSRFALRKLSIGLVSLTVGASMLGVSTELFTPSLFNEKKVFAAQTTGLTGNVTTQDELQNRLNSNQEIILSNDITITKTWFTVITNS